jgi:hypothetical protein
LSSPAGAVLGLIAVVSVGALALALKTVLAPKKSNGNGKESVEEIRLRVLKGLALIDREDVDMPGNWRDYVDKRIEHKLNNVLNELRLRKDADERRNRGR